MDVGSSVAQIAVVSGMYNRIHVFLRPPWAVYSRCLCPMTRIDAKTIFETAAANGPHSMCFLDCFCKYFMGTTSRCFGHASVCL